MVRLPIPSSPTLRISWSLLSINAAPTTLSFFSLKLMPFTPRLTRPIWRILFRRNFTHIPLRVTIRIILLGSSLSPSISLGLAPKSSFSMLISRLAFSSPSMLGTISPSSFSTMSAVTSSSFSSSLIARTPIERMFLYSLRFVRFTMPFLVKNASDLFGAKSLVGMIAMIFSSSCRLIRFTTALPFAVRLPSGIL